MTFNKSIFKKLGLLTLLVALVFTFAACDSDNGDDGTDVSEYNVNFTVENEAGDPVVDATVEMNGTTETTTDQGTAQFTGLTNDTYDYTVTADGYQDATGSVVVDGEAASETVTLTAATQELTVDSVLPIDDTTISVKFEEMDEAVEVTLDQALTDGQEEVTFTYDGTEYTANLDVPYGSTTIDGTLDSVTGEGEDVVVEIEDKEYPVSASYPGAGRYLAQIDSRVYGSNITVNLVNGEVAGIETIELVEDIDHIAFNTIVNPTYPGSEQDTGRVRGIEVVGTDTGTSVVESVSTQSGVSGPVVQIAMDRIDISGIEFDVGDVLISGTSVGSIGKDTSYDGSYVTLSDSSVVGDLIINSYDSTLNMSTIEGLVTINSEKTEFTADSITNLGGNALIINGEDANVDVANDIAGAIQLNATASDAMVNAENVDGTINIDVDGTEVTISDTVEGKVTLNGEGDFTADTVDADLDINAATVLDVNNVTGLVTLGADADLNQATIGDGVTIDAPDITVSEIDSPEGVLTITANGVTVEDSVFGELADDNSGINATLDTVTFDAMYETLSADNGNELEDTDTFTIGLEGWSFEDMTWPVEDEDITINVDVDANEVSFTNADFTGNVAVIGGVESALFTDSTFASDLDLSAAAAGTDTAPTIIGGELQNSVTGIVANTSFSGVTFDFDGNVAVNDVDGVSFTDSVVFKDAVEVSVDNLNTEDYTATFTDVVFEETASLDIGATSMDSDSLVTIDGATFGAEVATDFAGAGRIDVADAEFAYSDTAAEDITLSDSSLSIYFDNNTIYRPVTVTNAHTARFRNETVLYNDLTGTSGDVRVIDSEFVSDEAITITSDLTAPSLSLNGVDFTGTEDVTMTGTGDATFIGTINGGDLLTVDTSNVNVTTQSIVNDTIFDVVLYDIEDEVTFDGVTLNSGLDTTTLVDVPSNLTLKNTESGAALNLTGANVLLDTVKVTSGTVTLAGADAEANSVEVADKFNVDSADASLTDITITDTSNLVIDEEDAKVQTLTVDGDIVITAAGAEVNDADLTGNVDLNTFTAGTTTLNNVDASAVTITSTVAADSAYDVNWTGGTVDGTLTVNVNASSSDDETSNITFDGVDFTKDTSGDNFEITAADVLNINNGSIEYLDIAAGSTINDSFTIDGVTLTNNDVTINDNEAAADYVDIVIDEVALTVDDSDDTNYDADVTVAGGTITDLTGTSFKTLLVKDTVLQDLSANTVLDFAATFENNTFEKAVDVQAGASFEGDTFEDSLTITDGTATFTNIVNEIAADDKTITIGDSATIDGWTLRETGAGVLDSVVDSNQVLTLEGDIDWTDAPEFTINADASGANVNDDNANWIPEKPEILSIQ